MSNDPEILLGLSSGELEALAEGLWPLRFRLGWMNSSREDKEG